jgi:hypothetical protein
MNKSQIFLKVLPKGKYNGMTIDGIEIKFKITLLDWRFVQCKWNWGEPFIFFLCFKLRFGLHYVPAWMVKEIELDASAIAETTD